MEKGRAEIILDKLKEEVENAQSVPLSSGKVMISRDDFLLLLHNLEDNLKHELQVYREVTDKRAKIVNDAKKEAEEIIYEAEKSASRIRVTKQRHTDVPVFKQSDLTKNEKMALRTANDIYAASLIYTDEMLTEVDHLLHNAYSLLEQEYGKMMEMMQTRIAEISNNKEELVTSLNDLSKNDRYGQILEISQLLANELYHERELARMKEIENSRQMKIHFDDEPIEPETLDTDTPQVEKKDEKNGD